jgi:hypothetical protein
MTDWLNSLSSRHRLALTYWLLNAAVLVALLVYALR